MRDPVCARPAAPARLRFGQHCACFLCAAFALHAESPRSVSAHWDADVATVQSHAMPPLLFDYEGFPEEAYQLRWPAPGSPQLAARVRHLLTAAGLPSAEGA